MKFKSKLIASLILMGQMEIAHAALMRDDISVQTYRDFAENRGIFSPGATNVPIYNNNGSLSGYINEMPDFSSAVEGGYLVAYSIR